MNFISQSSEQISSIEIKYLEPQDATLTEQSDQINKPKPF